MQECYKWWRNFFQWLIKSQIWKKQIEKMIVHSIVFNGIVLKLILMFICYYFVYFHRTIKTTINKEIYKLLLIRFHIIKESIFYMVTYERAIFLSKNLFKRIKSSPKIFNIFWIFDTISIWKIFGTFIYFIFFYSEIMKEHQNICNLNVCSI